MDEMFAPAIADQLRKRGHDVVSLHDAEYRDFQGRPDEEIFAIALKAGRAIVTENVSDFRRLQLAAHSAGDTSPVVIFTTDRQFPRGQRSTAGRLVRALDRMLRAGETPAEATFLQA